MNVYAPQANFSEIKKDCFFQMLESKVTESPASEQRIVCGNMGFQFIGFEKVHDRQAIGKRNT